MKKKNNKNKKLLFIGGVHGIGKTTLTRQMVDDSSNRLGRVGESVQIGEFIFDHRYEIRDTAEVCWYARYVQMLTDAIYGSRSKRYNRFVVDRTIFDFVPYSTPLSADFIFEDGKNFLKFLEDQGHEIFQVFLTCKKEILIDRITKRNRPNTGEELETLHNRMAGFFGLATRLNLPIINHERIKETSLKLRELFPKFFEV